MIVAGCSSKRSKIVPEALPCRNPIMILYPTETIYGLGVNALDERELAELFALKGRDERQTVSWLVRHEADIVRYAEVSKTAKRLIAAFLPGPLTLILPAKETVPLASQAADGTLGFRISADPIAQQLIADFMANHDAPLTCTSANVSGQSPQATVAEIHQQFIDAGKADMIRDWQVYDDGPRQGKASTVVKVEGVIVKVLREGAIKEADIRNAI